MAREYHEFEGIAEGTADRPCTRCGLPDRHPVHALPDGYHSPVFRLAADLSRTAGQIALVEAYTRAVRRASEQGIREGREALAAALLSELDTAKPDLLAILGPNGLESQVIAARATWKAFADHIRGWLEVGAPERPLLDTAWERINALGDGGVPGGDYVQERSLEIIEQLGGMDPARRKAVDRG